MLCECLLYFSYMVALIQFYVAQCCMGVYYIVQAFSCIHLTKILHCKILSMSYTTILQLIIQFVIHYSCNSRSHCILFTYCACSFVRVSQARFFSEYSSQFIIFKEIIYFSLNQEITFRAIFSFRTDRYSPNIYIQEDEIRSFLSSMKYEISAFHVHKYFGEGECMYSPNHFRPIRKVATCVC